MSGFAQRNPVWTVIIAVIVAGLLWMMIAPWPEGLEAFMGRKRIFLNAVFNGITLGALYFLVASGFTLIFGLMKNVNLAHGSLYLLGGYIGYEFAEATGSWLGSFVVSFIVIAALGVVLQYLVFRRMEGQDLRQTLVTIGISVVLADIMLWVWGGQSYQILTPDWLSGPVTLPLISGTNRSGELVYLTFPAVRIAILVASIALGILMWLALNRTRVGMLIRAGSTNAPMVSALGVNIKALNSLVFALGAALAGLAGLMSGPILSVQPGMGDPILILTLVVIIIGGIGSVRGALLGALLVGVVDTVGRTFLPIWLGAVFQPTIAQAAGPAIASMLIYLLMAAVLAFRPQGLFPARA